jgi:hypothetical protein
MDGPKRYNFDEIERQIKERMKDGNFYITLFKSVENIINVVLTIYKTNGVGWASKVVDSSGTPLFSQIEQARFTEMFKPYVPYIVEFFGNTTDEDSLDTLDIDETDRTQVGGVDFNQIIGSISNTLDSANETTNRLARQYGILKLENDIYLKDDIKIPKEALNAAEKSISTAFPPATPAAKVIHMILSYIKVNFQMILTGVTLALDVGRIQMGYAGEDNKRRILSLLLALLELLRGDWRSALSSFLGVFGMTPLFIGEMIRAFLFFYRKIDTSARQHFFNSSTQFFKSMIMGLLLYLFKEVAPENARQLLFDKISTFFKGSELTEGLTWDNLDKFQARLGDPKVVCGDEFQNFMQGKLSEIEASDKENAVMVIGVIKTILEIFGIPTDKSSGLWQEKCGSNGPATIPAPVTASAPANVPVTTPVTASAPANVSVSVPVTVPVTAPVLVTANSTIVPSTTVPSTNTNSTIVPAVVEPVALVADSSIPTTPIVQSVS